MKPRVRMGAALLLSIAAALTSHAMSAADPSKAFADPQAAALADAAASGDAARVRSLVAAGANANANGDNGITVLEWAMRSESKNGVIALLDAGADPQRAGIGGATPLHLAALANDPAYLKILLEHGADPNTPHATTGAPPLSAALMNPNRAAFDLLLAAHADPNRADRMGDTPLHVAAQVHKSDLVLRLLEAGADATRRNEADSTFQVYFNIAPAGGFSAEGRARHDAVNAWLSAHGVAIEAGSQR